MQKYAAAFFRGIAGDPAADDAQAGGVCVFGLADVNQFAFLVEIAINAGLVG